MSHGPPTFEVTETLVRVKGTVEHQHPSVVDYLGDVDEDERLDAYQHLVRLGAVCAERAEHAGDIEFVRNQLQRLLTEVKDSVGDIPEETREQLEESVGTEDGSVLDPIKNQVDNTEERMQERVGEIEGLIEEALDPENDESNLSEVFTKLENLLDPQRKDSIYSMVEELIETATAKDGQLVSTVESTVDDRLEERFKPLREDVDKMREVLIGDEAAEEVTEQTPLKGHAYQETVEAHLREWAQNVSAEVRKVGDDNQPGDFVLKLPGSVFHEGLSLVVEAKDDEKGRGEKRLNDAALKGLEERDGDAYLLTGATHDAFGVTIPDVTQGSCQLGPWVACTHEHLITAIRVAELMVAEARLREAEPDVDTQGIQAQLDRLQNTMEHLTNIKKKTTSIEKTTQDIDHEADKMRDKVSDILLRCREAIRQAAEEATTSVDGTDGANPEALN